MSADAHDRPGDGSQDGRPGPAYGPDGDNPDVQRAADGDEQTADAPDLLDAIRQLGTAGRAGLDAAGDTAKAIGSLVTADVALAGNALARAGIHVALAALLGGSAWLLLMATVVAFLSLALGIPWSLSLLLTGLLSGLLAALLAWRALGYLKHARLQATRRQLSRLDLGGLADPLAKDMPSPAPRHAR